MIVCFICLKRLSENVELIGCGCTFQPVVDEKVKTIEIVPEQCDKPMEEGLCWEDKEEKIGDEIKDVKENDTGSMWIIHH